MICSLIFEVVFNGDDDGRSCVCVFGLLGECIEAFHQGDGFCFVRSIAGSPSPFSTARFYIGSWDLGRGCGICVEDDGFDLDFRMEQVCMVGCWLGCFFELVLGR